ncbi:hypothetical protein [Pseudaestuariivita rosea]|uniref:hypothetical protein n=1 Tax=Pseudaestuariivita rosea TaxID=2763263 RepID=UPI001ABB55BE|nr:hypothetical protein [Pseudaestuariivita rosea]
MQRVIAVVVVWFCLTATVLHAQALQFDAAAVQTACSQDAAVCRAATNTALQQILAENVDDALRNTQIGALAAAIAQGLRTAQNADPAAIGQILKDVASASTDPRQTQAITQLAERIIAGQGLPVDLLQPVASSPA